MDQWFRLLKKPIVKFDLDIQKDIYYSFYKYVYSDIKLILRDHGSTEDIIQEAFLKISKIAPKLTHDIHIRSWVRQVTRNMAIDCLRKNKNKPQIPESSEVYFTNDNIFITGQRSVESEVENNEKNKLLHQALNELKKEHRLPLLMFYWQEKSYREICRELQITEQVLTQRMARARKKLHQYFSRKWIDTDY